MSNVVMINPLNIPICTYEELQAIAASPVCLNCGHKEIIHNCDYEHGEHCHLCDCNRVVKEGDFSHWSMKLHESKLKWRSITQDAPNIYIQKALTRLLDKPLKIRI